MKYRGRARGSPRGDTKLTNRLKHTTHERHARNNFTEAAVYAAQTKLCLERAWREDNTARLASTVLRASRELCSSLQRLASLEAEGLR